MPKLFCDLDAVLVNFNKALTDLMGYPVTKDMNIDRRDDIWAKVDEGGADFWASMGWEPDGRQLWDAVKGRNPTILSAPTRDPSSKVGKKRWVADNLGSDVPVILDKHKEKYAKPGDILIDDRQKNISKWEKAGGVGILHKDTASTLSKLKEALPMEKKAFKVEMVDDPSNPGRRVPVVRDRGGRSTKVVPPKKGGKYKREKRDWSQDVEASSMRVVKAYLDMEADLVSDVVQDYKRDIDELEKAYKRFKSMDPQRTQDPYKAFRINRDVGSKLEAAKWQLQRLEHGDRGANEELWDNIMFIQRNLKQYPPVKELLDKAAAEGAFKFKAHPLVIDPYDAVVQQAHREMGQAGKDIDVIKLETTCPGDRVAWVTNQDLFGGEEGKKRVVHLCLNKIKDEFRKLHGSPYTMGSPADARRMKDLVRTYLKDVVLPHEATHIEQETKGQGKFGPSPEMGAERAEQWGGLEQMGIVKKATIAQTVPRRSRALYRLGFTESEVKDLAEVEIYLQSLADLGFPLSVEYHGPGGEDAKKKIQRSREMLRRFNNVLDRLEERGKAMAGAEKEAGFFPEGYDPEKGVWTDRPTRSQTRKHERRNPLFSFKRLNSRAVNEVRRKLLDMKDPKATKIWDYIQTGLMGTYTPEQEDELRRIIEDEARNYSLEVGGMVNSLFRGQPMRESPLYQKFATHVVMRYLSECNT